VVRPRFAASVLTGVSVASSFRGVYARAVRKLRVSSSMVSKVADGHRISSKIQAALREEPHAIKQKPDSERVKSSSMATVVQDVVCAILLVLP
jgi:hypothetical protein